MTPPRAKGEGSVSYQASRKRWVAEVTAYKNGKRRPIRAFARTELEAVELLPGLRSRARRMLPGDLDRQTVGQYLEQWLRDVVEVDLRPLTVRTYESVVRGQIIPSVGRVPLRRLNAQHVQTMMTELAARGLAPRTINGAKKVLGRAIEQARELQVYDGENPVRLVRERRIEARRRVYAMSLSEVKRLLVASAKDRLVAMYVVSVFTGLRQGETLGLRWEDVDLDGRLLVVHAQMQHQGDAGFQRVQPKSAAGTRPVSLPRVVTDALEAHRERQRKERDEAGGLWDKTHDLVFCTQTGTPLFARNVVRAFKARLASCVECGRSARQPHHGHEYRRLLPEMRWHDMRRTHSTLLATRVAPATLRDRMGHSSVTMTLDVYTDVPSSEEQRVAGVLDDMLLEAGIEVAKV